MKTLKLILFTVLMIGFVFPVGEAGAVFLLIAPGAAAQGTGEANVARVDDAYASYYNPASLAFQTKTSVVGMHVNWLKTLVPDLYYEFIGFSKPGYGGTLGGHLIFLSLGEQQATDTEGNPLGDFKSYMWALDGSYGTKLTKNSAIGLGFKLFHQKLADRVTQNESGEGKPYSTDFAFDVAYLYRNLKQNGNDRFKLGFNIANIGPPIAFIDEDQADPAPTNIRFGFFANLYETKFTRFNILMDFQKLLVASYPQMDWDGDRYIGSNLNELGDGTLEGSYLNGNGQNEKGYSDPWYKAWATAWLDDWYYGGDLDHDLNRYIGGYYWVDGYSSGGGAALEDGIAQPQELVPENGNSYYSPWDVDGDNDLDDDGIADYYDSDDIIYVDNNNDGIFDEDEESLPYGQGPYGCENCTENSQGFLDGAGDVVLELGSKEDRRFSKELEEVIVNTGFEFWYTESFVLRLGYIYDQEGAIKNPTFGAGVKFEGYGFDFGYTAGEQGHPRSNSLFFSLSAEI